MRESPGYPQHPLVLARELDRYALAKHFGTPSKIDRNVQNLAFYYPHEFALHVLDLVMESAQYILCRAGMIVLHESVINTEAGKIFFVIALQKKSARVPKHPGFEHKNIRQRGGNFRNSIRYRRRHQRSSKY